MYKRICKYCGKEFETESKARKFCLGPHYSTCEYCGKQFEIKDIHYISRTCSRECESKLRKEHAEETSLKLYGVKNAGYTKESQEKIKQTNREKYGVDYAFQAKEVKAKIEQTNLERYGVDNPNKSETIKAKIAQTNLERYGDTCTLGKNSSIREKFLQQNIEKYGTTDPGNLPENLEKRKQTNRERYGVDYYTQTEESKERIKNTCMEKYGVSSPTQSEEVKAKIRQTNMKRYGVQYNMQIPEIKQKISDICMEKYGVTWPCLLPQCVSASKKHSSINVKFEALMQKYNIDFEFEYPLERRSYDFKAGNVLIEINPTYTHTSYENVHSKFGAVSKDYHLNKTKLALKHGYRCIHVWDWDDWEKIIYQLLPKTHIYARNCELREVSIEECSEFLNNYHIQNTCKGQTVRLGLYQNGKLLEIMTFGKPRYSHQYQWELLRLCSEPSISIVGGASKLFHYFTQTYDPESVISYCNLSKFTGMVYHKIKMKHLYDTEPNMVWSYDKKIITNNLLLQRGYDQLFNTNYGKGTSNEELMLSHGWLPVYDCGQGVYGYRRGE